MKETTLFTLVLTLGLMAEAAKADFTFGSPTNLGSTINSPVDDTGPSMSADGLSLFFDSDRAGGYGAYDIWVTRRGAVGEPWGEPMNLGTPVNSASCDFAPSISADGLELYFGSNRGGHFDLWVSARATTEDNWGEPVSLAPTITSPGITEAGPSISADGLSLFFKAYDRPGGYGGDDIWVSTRPTRSDPWGPPVNLGPNVNSSWHDQAPSISADGLVLFFSSDRYPGGYGDYDLYVTTRASKEDEWGVPINLGPNVNSVTSESLPCISPDGSELYFGTYPMPRGGCGRSDLWRVSITPIVDLDGDGTVGAMDALVLIENWGVVGSPTDLTANLCDIAPLPLGDGIVDSKDLRVLAEHMVESVEDMSDLDNME